MQSRTISHKSLQCEVEPRREVYDANRSPIRIHNERGNSPPSRIRSHENFGSPVRGKDKCPAPVEHRNYTDKCVCCPPTNMYGCDGKVDIGKSRSHMVHDDYHTYHQDITPTASCVNARHALHRPEQREYRQYVDRRDRYAEDRRRYCEQKASRSFEVQREYADDVRGTSRSDPHKGKRAEAQRSRRCCDRHGDRYYEEKPVLVKERVYGLSQKEKSRRHLEQSDRSSIVSRDVDDRDRLSEREKDSGLSGADGETSTISGRSNYMRVVKVIIINYPTLASWLMISKELVKFVPKLVWFSELFLLPLV